MSLAELSRVITPKGYALKKDTLTEEQTIKIRTELLMSPKVCDKYQKVGQSPFPIYYESKSRFYVPRNWGIKYFGEPEANIVEEGLMLNNNITFKIFD